MVQMFFSMLILGIQGITGMVLDMQDQVGFPFVLVLVGVLVLRLLFWAFALSRGDEK